MCFPDDFWHLGASRGAGYRVSKGQMSIRGRFSDGVEWFWEVGRAAEVPFDGELFFQKWPF